MKRLIALLVVILFGSGLLSPAHAAADTLPVPVSTTASSAPSIGGVAPIVWAQAIHGNTVYYTGHFSTPGRNIGAYNLATGASVAFPHSLTTNGDGQTGGRAISISPSGRYLAVAGSFTLADGVAANNLAIWDLSTGRRLPGFTGFDARISAVAVTDSRVFVGGYFHVGKQYGTAAFDLATGKLAPGWQADINPGGRVYALLVVANTLYVSGSFTSIRGVKRWSIAAVSVQDASVVSPWASGDDSWPIKDQVQANPIYPNSYSGITSMSYDKEHGVIDATSEGDGAIGGVLAGHPPDISNFFEGRFGIRPSDGILLFVNDCHGNSHTAWAQNGILYSGSHAHDCSNMGYWADGERGVSNSPLLAETSTGVIGANLPPRNPDYTSFAGLGHTSQVNWYPNPKWPASPAPGGRGDPVWSIVGNGVCISVAGQFTQINGVPQVGLTRFCPRTIGDTWPDGTIVLGATSGKLDLYFHNRCWHFGAPAELYSSPYFATMHGVYYASVTDAWLTQCEARPGTVGRYVRDPDTGGIYQIQSGGVLQHLSAVPSAPWATIPHTSVLQATVR